MNDPYEHEPLTDHAGEEGEVVAVHHGTSTSGRILGGIALVGAVLLTVGAFVLLLTPPSASPTPVPAQPTDSAAVAIPTATPFSEQPAVEGQPTSSAPELAALPTLAPEAASALLNQPVVNLAAGESPIEYVRNTYNPFTIIPDRPRNEVIQYEVQSGDTIFTIAERYGLKPETIAWSNDRSIIGGLRPGRQINIMPVDGAYITVATEQSITDIAATYGVDPYTIIDSEFNDLFGAEPDTLLPVGTKVVIPGGSAEAITWTARVERTGEQSTSGNSGGGGGGQIRFEPGDPGSCGWTDNPGGSGNWTNPMGGPYTWSRGFTSWHSGVDLAAPPGTPVKAALGGSVIFAGWNSYGYGYLIVLAHGPYTTLYGHLSEIYVSCGQYVGAGQVIGGVGSTGDSSGPHLHFEIRSNDVPQDPTYTMPF
ncbi:MAG: peptidoglycan DD-metalloendopeptidase family protein [Anaerolineae bacterium]